MKSRIVPRRTGAVATLAAPSLHRQRGADGVERLSVYAEGYLERTRQALAEVYEATQHLVGARRFAQLSRAFAEQVPSRTYNLSRRGEGLPAVLSTHPLARAFPFLPDLAQLEWCITQAFHAVEEPALDAGQLPASSLNAWAQMRVSFQPSVRVVASAWPIRDLWEARTRSVAEISIELIGRPQRVLVFRRDVHVRCELLDEPSHRVMDALLQGATLGEACAWLPSSEHQAERAAASLTERFAHWTRSGLIVRCDVPTRPPHFSD